jgi:hypothetical protein
MEPSGWDQRLEAASGFASWPAMQSTQSCWKAFSREGGDLADIAENNISSDEIIADWCWMPTTMPIATLRISPREPSP